jgi:hypothetical protein
MSDFSNRSSYERSDIQWLLDNAIEENISLDFKANGALDKTDGKKREVGKDITAFANSAGGVIVYGILEKDHKADSLSFIDGRAYTKEWLEHIINSNCSRRIEGVEIFPVRNNGKMEETVYVVRVPESLDAPHMISDGRYYKRYNFESIVMQEYEVRQLYNRVRKSVLDFDEIRISIGHKSTASLDNLLKAEKSEFAGLLVKEFPKAVSRPFIGFDLSVTIRNTGVIPEDRFQLQVKCPKHLIAGKPVLSEPERNVIRAVPYRIISRRELPHDTITVPIDGIIFPNEVLSVWDASIRYTDWTSRCLQTDSTVTFTLFYAGGICERKVNILDVLVLDGKKVTPGSLA